MTELHVVGDDTPDTEFTLDVSTFRAEFFGCSQVASGDKKLTLLVDRLDRYMVDELADVGLTMEFTVRRRPSAVDSPDHPSRPKPRGKKSPDEPVEDRPAHSSHRTGRRRSGESPALRQPGDPSSYLLPFPVPGHDDD